MSFLLDSEQHGIILLKKLTVLKTGGEVGGQIGNPSPLPDKWLLSNIKLINILPFYFGSNNSTVNG